MVDKKAIKRYHVRRDSRLRKRGFRMDVEWEENKHPRDEGGKFTSGSGGETAGKSEEAKPVSTVKMSKTKSPKTYVKKLSEAKKSLPPEEGAWRVTDYESGEQFNEWHPGAKMFASDGGSTIAVTPDGDIVGVCRHDGDAVRGKDMLKYAVENGGKKLDAYEGLYGFYTRCGFEPVSWCEWDEQYAPGDWVKGRDNPENIIFYKYTGQKSKYGSAKEFFKNVKASKDYDAAKDERDKALRGA